MPNKFTTAEFIARAEAVHGERYDYSLVDYLGLRQKVEIVCPTHGSFMQAPVKHHLMGRGCPACAITKRAATKRANAAARASATFCI